MVVVSLVVCVMVSTIVMGLIYIAYLYAQRIGARVSTQNPSPGHLLTVGEIIVAIYTDLMRKRTLHSVLMAVIGGWRIL